MGTNDQDKTKSELIDELAGLRRQVGELKTLVSRRNLSEEQMQERQVPRIGEILMEKGYVTDAQLEVCLQKRKEAKDKLLGEIMVETGIINTEQLLDALAQQLKMVSFSLQIAEQ